MVRLPIAIEAHRLPRDELLALAFFAPADAGALCELDRDPEHRRRFQLQYVEIRVEPDNVASRRVALASSFRQAGVRAGHVVYHLQVDRAALPPGE